MFSLEPHDFVRTRLTHSVEVATVGRSLGEGSARLISQDVGFTSETERFKFERDVGTIVATACLLHDIGNPPFGHSGEHAIGKWFEDNIGEDGLKLLMGDDQEKADLLEFEGNAQSFRIATRLQWTGRDFGMNLTAATLSTLIKYPCASSDAVRHEKRDYKPVKKFGYFKADAYAFKQVREFTKLEGHRRHPLTYLMEAADDIAYVTGDIEDVLKKGFVDYATIRDALVDGAETEDTKKCVADYLEKPFSTDFAGCEPKERQQLSVQRFCQMAVRLMTKSAIQSFHDNFSSIMNGSFAEDLAGTMSMSDLCKTLRGIMERHVYPSVEIAHREQTARSVISGLLSTIMDVIRNSKQSALATSTYREARRHATDTESLGDSFRLGDAYRLALRATDYISGMTDGFALTQYQRIFGMRATP